MVFNLFSQINVQMNSQVLNETLPNRTPKVTRPTVHSPTKLLTQQCEVPTPSILSSPYQLCQAFNLPGDIPVFPAWNGERDKHTPLWGKSLLTPTPTLRSTIIQLRCSQFLSVIIMDWAVKRFLVALFCLLFSINVPIFLIDKNKHLVVVMTVRYKTSPYHHPSITVLKAVTDVKICNFSIFWV